MIGFASPTVDVSGDMIFLEDQGKSRLDPPSTRLDKSACLDGSVYIGHYGEVEGDRTFSIVIPDISLAEYEFLKRLKSTYTSLVIACREGVFTGVLESLRLSVGTLTAKIEISERIDSE